MSRIARCGNCQKRVTVPEGLGKDASVRCPICQAVYPLSELPAQAVNADDAETPPELVPVAQPSQPGPAAESLPDEPEARERQQGPFPEANRQPEQASEAGAGEGPETADEEEGAPEGPPDRIDEWTREAVEAPPVAAGIEPRDEERASARAETDNETQQAEGSEGEQEAAGDEAVAVSEAEEEVCAGERPLPDEPEEDRAGEDAESAEHATEPGEKPAEAAASEETVRVRCPHCQAEYPLRQVVVVTTGAELGPAMAAAVSRYLLSGEGTSSEAPALDVWAKADGVPQIDLGEDARSQAVSDHAGAFDFAREDAQAEAGPTGPAGLRPRRRNQKSVARELAGWVFGGVAGLVIAYYLLNFIRGEAGNFLKIPLPGVSHSYQYSPDWFPGWMQAAAESEEEASKEIADLSEVFEPALSEEAKAPAQPTPTLRPSGSGDNPSSDGPYSGLGGAAPAIPPRAFPPGYVGLADPPSYPPDALGEALEAAHQSLGEKGEPISEKAYAAWCRLAEVVTFVHGGPGAKHLRERKAAAGTLLAEIGRNEANLDKIGFQAGARCVADHRPSNGILLAGKVTGIASQGNAHGAHVELAASGQTIVVAARRPLPAKEADSVLILGRIVDDPAKNLIGFKTRQPLVVWAGLTVKIEP